MALPKETAVEAIKAAPPVSVTAAVLSGVSVADVIQWLTVLYLVLQVAYLLAKWRRESRATRIKSERQACAHDK
ncbi:hypothetical protein LHK_02004 [Laribacter hongkongensis HLHK9]|uniref:Holin n=1 Tax=Laribacter hongkongensis (strain HLHK9) TaxID=557598 RepID=C1D948_LARHH|nr:hypothetical protein [Laribacter hongkongensis]ACO74988.1 hypothetical protein LHK_02004 [Laribacter hongkongensis HLHK9]